METSKSLLPYQYQPLEFSDSIRLLRLEPATSKNEGLRGMLVDRSLSILEDDLNTHYAALSYVWGDPTRTKSIELVNEVESFRHGLTTNLFEVLINIREANRAVLIWADAICIDQSNIDERGHQVKLMGNIYHGAGCTVVYLGPLSESIKYLFDATIQQPPEWQIEDMKRAVADFWSREWFTRGWVFQELILSHNPRVQCGRYRVGWDRLRKAILDCFGWSTPSNTFHKMCESRDNRQFRTFSQLVISRKNAKVSDPRDYFFCLMGIVADGYSVQKFLPADYSLGVEDVFIKVAKRTIRELGLSEVLAHVNTDTGRFGLPSFVPTWGVPSLQSTSHDDPRQSSSPSSKVDILERCLISSRESHKAFKVKKLSAAIPSASDFADAFRANLASRVPDTTPPGTEDPTHTFQDVQDQWYAQSPDVCLDPMEMERPWLIIHQYQRRLWERFSQVIREYRTRHVTDSDLIEESSISTLLSIEGSLETDIFNSIFLVIEQTIQELGLSNDWATHDGTPRYRWAFCEGRIAMVPPDTTTEDVIVPLSGSDCGYWSPDKWYVVRPAEGKLLQREKDAVAEHILSVYHPSPKWVKGLDDEKEVIRLKTPVELSINYAEVKAPVTVLDDFGMDARQHHWRRSYMVLV